MEVHGLLMMFLKAIYKTAFVSWELGRAAALSNILLAIVMVITITMFIYTKVRDARSAKAQAIAENY